MSMGHDVFISYSSRDKVFADAICHRLEQSRIRCWIAPRDIQPGQDWAESIINGLDAARLLVLVFSSNSNKSPQVKREVERSVSKGRMILPFRIEDVPLSKSLEYFISSQHWLDAINGNLEAHLSQLTETVELLLSRSDVAGAEFTRALQLSGVELQRLKATRAPAPSMPADAAASPGISPEAVLAVEAALAQAIGPIARHLVKRQLKSAQSVADLAQALAGDVDDPAERKQFLGRCAALK